MLALLLVEADTILEKRYYKKNMIGPFCFGGGKIVFTLLIKIIADHVVIIFINVTKTDFEGTLIRAFCSRKSIFHYYLNDVLYVFISINL